MEKILLMWKRVFGNLRYTLIAIAIAIFFYAINVLITDFSILRNFYSSLGFPGTARFFITLMVGFKDVIKWYSYISLVIISLLIGILFSLIFYRINFIKSVGDKKTNALGFLGVVIGSIAPGCSACGIGLASSLGLSAVFLAFLPLKGLEFSILAILILGSAIYNFSNDSCKIKVNKKVKGGQ